MVRRTSIPPNLPRRSEEDERLGTRKRQRRQGVVTNSGLIDSDAVVSDYIGAKLYDTISAELGYNMNTVHCHDTFHTSS